MIKRILFTSLLCALSLAAAGVQTSAATLQEGGGRAAVYYRDGARFALEGRLEEAVAAFEQTIALDPKNGNAYYSLGNVYLELGRWADASDAYTQAISINKSDVEAYNGLGIALGRQRLYGQSAAAFEKAIDLYPKWAEPHYHLSQIYQTLGRETAAQVSYKQAIRRRPDYVTHPPRTFTTVPVAADVAAAGFGSERAPAARKAAANSSRTPDNRPPSRATPNGGNTTTPAATRETASATERAKADDAGSDYDLGLRHSRAGRHEEAVVSFRRAILADRDNPAAYFALGDAYAALGRWRESVDAYEQTVRLNPKDGEAYERLGRSYAKLRETTPVVVNDSGAAVGVRAGATSGMAAESAEGLREKATSDGSAPTQRLADSERRAAAPGASDLGADPATVYRVGPGDVLDVRVLNAREPRATSYTVTPSGLLEYPSLSEPLQVVGLTTDEIESRIGAELKRRGLAANSDVAVGVSEYASHAVIVSGLVRDAGTKILRREGVPLYVIIAVAQPLPEAGRALVVSHLTGRTTTVDLSDSAAMNMLARPGDVITVQANARQFFYIAGAVREPGQKEFHKGLTLTQAVLAAGGLTSPSMASVTVARQGTDGRLSATKYDLKEIGTGKAPDPGIQPGDRIEVLR
jgi:protein involved in polysaccharide export with SLBB domain/Flp pilus assembly protein TadD